jgi:hypothetical protein
MALVCAAALRELLVLRVRERWKQRLWAWVLGLIGLASALGAIVHAIDWSPSARAGLWTLLYLSLGLGVAAFFAGIVQDLLGEAWARRTLPWAAAVGVAFWLLTEAIGGSFLIFIVFESIVMAVGLVVYSTLAAKKQLPGAGLVAAGIAVTIVAGVVQASRLGIVIIVPFDHNGLFHLIQLTGMLLVAVGLRRALIASSAS